MQVCNHPDLFEGRPIVSAFDMPGLSLQYPSCVMSGAWGRAWQYIKKLFVSKTNCSLLHGMRSPGRLGFAEAKLPLGRRSKKPEGCKAPSCKACQ